MKRYVKSASTSLCKNALNASLGDTVYDRLKERYGEVVREGQSGNYNIIYVDFNDGSRPLKINVMDDAQRVGRFCLVEGQVNASTNIVASVDDFYEWYDKLPSIIQYKIDDIADDMGLPVYDECSDEELATLHDAYVSSKKK